MNFMASMDYSILQAKEHEISLMVDLAAKEGWNPGIYDAQCFYQADPNGFFLGKKGDTLVAVGSGVKYNNEFAFFGLYIVVDEFRGLGYGIQLTKAIFEYMGNLNIGLDGVPAMQSQYAKLGFKLCHYNIRYAGKLRPTLLSNPAIVEIASIPFEVLFNFDCRYFPAERQNFLKSWIAQPESKALGYWQDDKLLGYGVIRRCIQGFKIGPLFAETPQIAHDLFLHLAAHAKGAEVFLDVIEANTEAMRLVKNYGFDKKFVTVRMYTRYNPSIPIQNIYGITTFELG